MPISTIRQEHEANCQDKSQSRFPVGKCRKMQQQFEQASDIITLKSKKEISAVHCKESRSNRYHLKGPSHQIKFA
jgi:hypothetical protein